jgi:hypothetical protein
MMYRMFIGKPKSSNENEVKGEGVYQNDLTSLEEGAFKPVAQGKRREYMDVPDNTPPHTLSVVGFFNLIFSGWFGSPSQAKANNEIGYNSFQGNKPVSL